MFEEEAGGVGRRRGGEIFIVHTRSKQNGGGRDGILVSPSRGHTQPTLYRSLSDMTTGTVTFNLHPQCPTSKSGQNITQEHAHKCTNFRDNSGTPYFVRTQVPISNATLTYTIVINVDNTLLYTGDKGDWSSLSLVTRMALRPPPIIVLTMPSSAMISLRGGGGAFDALCSPDTPRERFCGEKKFLPRKILQGLRRNSKSNFLHCLGLI